MNITELSIRIKEGTLTATSLVESILSYIRDRDPACNAFVRLTAERAVKEAETLDNELKRGVYRGPLHGIPYAIKDLFDVKGQPNSAGVTAFNKHVATEDAALVQRLNKAGAILIGQTHTSPLAATILGINHTYGTPRNPWKTTHYIPGGSSGGSAVSVAAGMVPFSIGTDTGGSVRVPAALCGIIGFRPATGVIDLKGCRPLSPSLDAPGCFCHTVEDVLTVYGALTHTSVPADRRQFKIALPDNIFFNDVRPDLARAIIEQADALQAEKVNIPELEELHTLMRELSLIAAEAYELYQEIIDDPESDWVIHWVRNARTYTPLQVKTFREHQQRLSGQISQKLEAYDAIIVPTVPYPGIPFSDCNTPDQHTYWSGLMSRNTMMINLLGWPSITVPFTILSDGLPAALMIATAPHKESVLFSLAGLIAQQIL